MNVVDSSGWLEWNILIFNYFAYMIEFDIKNKSIFSIIEVKNLCILKEASKKTIFRKKSLKLFCF